MMIKRIACFLSAVIVATSSVFAWDAYSFTGVYDVVSSAPVVVPDDTKITSLTTFDDWYSHLSIDDSTKYFGPSVVNTYDDSNPIFGGQSFTTRWVNPPDSLAAFNKSANYFHIYNVTPYSINSKDSSGDVYYDFLTNYYFAPSANGSGRESHPYVRLNLDLSDFDTFSAFSLSGNLYLYCLISAATGISKGNYVALYVNDMLVENFYCNDSNLLDFRDYIYSGSVPITSVYFLFYTGNVSYAIPDSGLSNFIVSLIINQPNMRFDILSDTSIIDGFVDEAQDDINSHESVESQWTGSMTSNFDSLDLDSFTFPSGLLSGFSLITGIFQDLWNGMGDYKILYVFPLFLGIALLLIGRISKFSGGQSSSRSNRGDDDA